MSTTEGPRAGLGARHTVVIFLVSLAGLLLEVGYTRIVSFKLFYYYVYLVLGLALLGIGSGGIFVVVWPRLRQAATDTVVAVCSIVGAVSIAVGYFVVARVKIDTLQIWDYGSKTSFKNLGMLGIVCLALFASFIALGIIVSTLLGRGGSRVGGLYFADLIGAGLGCALAIPLIVTLGPPQVVMVAALIFGIVGIVVMPRDRLAVVPVGIVVVALAVLSTGFGLPDVTAEPSKGRPHGTPAASDWGPVFRVDAFQLPDLSKPGHPPLPFMSLWHDGTFGSIIPQFDGNAAATTRFDEDPRSLPFGTLGAPPGHTLIIGSAGGNEIVAALHYKSKRIDGVELNPVTVDLVEHKFRTYSGDLAHQPGVKIHQGDGRSYLARSDSKYDLVWFVAPDSYAANNAASSGAFVLSESYLYTTQMIKESLRHLTDRGMIVVQFGELDFKNAPNRTSRYVMTARRALSEMGIKDPGAHLIVSPYITNKSGDLATVMVKRTPFTPAEVARYQAAVQKVPLESTAWAPGVPKGPGIVPRLIDADSAKAAAVAATYPRQISAVSDDSPFFWHFSSFSNVIRNFGDPIDPIDPGIVIGERVLLLLLGVAVVFASLFLLAPFLFVRKEWRALPAKGISALYFAALGLGFILFEISMIQRLVLFLGYPTYSLTVTLASLLVFTGVGALWSNRLVDRAQVVVPVVFLALCGLTVFYEFGLDSLKDGLLAEGLAVRVIVTLVVLAPLGVCLGMFMPLGLNLVNGLSDHPDEYVAWSWAVNGFFSVIGSVLTTILAMSIGFRSVQLVALGVYAVAVLAYLRLRQRAGQIALQRA